MHRALLYHVIANHDDPIHERELIVKGRPNNIPDVRRNAVLGQLMQRGDEIQVDDSKGAYFIADPFVADKYDLSQFVDV